MSRTELAVAEIREMVSEFLAEAMRDPDIASQSADFRRGYDHGFREAITAFVAL